MSLRPPSFQRQYETHWSGDPALHQPPKVSDPPTDEERLARDAYRAKLKSARETGDWSALKIEGQTPTKFVLGQVDRNDWRALGDRFDLDESNPRRVGLSLALSLLFRMAIKSIPGWGEPFTRRSDSEWDGWEMAPAELVTQLDEIDPAIVSEIGWSVLERLRGVSPLS